MGWSFSEDYDLAMLAGSYKYGLWPHTARRTIEYILYDPNLPTYNILVSHLACLLPLYFQLYVLLVKCLQTSGQQQEKQGVGEDKEMHQFAFISFRRIVLPCRSIRIAYL